MSLVQAPVRKTTLKTRRSSKGAINLGSRSITNADLKHIASDELLSNGALAYEDGYADGRTFGPDGKFIAAWYSSEERVKYLVGFAAGVRVYNVRKERYGI